MNTDIEIGIVLRSERVKDADVKISVLGASGLKTVYATGVAKQNAKMKSAVQLFTVAEFSITGHKLTGACVLQTGIGITRDINRYYLACAVAETILKIQHTNAQIFALVVRTIEILGNSDVSCFKIFINFFLKLLVFLGYDLDSSLLSDECNRVIEHFKDTENENIDEIKVSLNNARECIKQIKISYFELLDFVIPNADIFL